MTYEFMPAARMRDYALNSLFIYKEIENLIDLAANENKTHLNVDLLDVAKEVISILMNDLEAAGYSVNYSATTNLLSINW